MTRCSAARGSYPEKSAEQTLSFRQQTGGFELLGIAGDRLDRQISTGILRRQHEATKRGFGPGCGKLIQIVTDGEPDFATCATEYFPEAMHTLDVMHVIEKLWTAGECLLGAAAFRFTVSDFDQLRAVTSAAQLRAAIRAPMISIPYDSI